MPKHEQYEELSTLAMIGEASATELKNLKSHLSQCPDCRHEYFEFVQFVLPQLSLAADCQPVKDLKPEDRETIRSNFLTRAAKAGVPFSEEAIAGMTSGAQPPQVSFRKSLAWSRHAIRYAAAGALCVLVLGGVFFVGRRSRTAMAVLPANEPHAQPLPSQTPDPRESSSAAPTPSAQRTQIAALRKDLYDTMVRLDQAKAAAEASVAERAKLREEVEKQSIQLKQVEGEKQSSDDARVSLQAELEKLKQKESSLEADYAGQVAAVVELTEKLNEQKATAEGERQLALTESEVRDLMASRNLHIVDVFDTDTRGKTKPIFGRVFFAENKQLVFYAYDLNEVQGRGTKIDYRVWGQKEGPGTTAKSLGVFHPDGKAQNRWVFKSDDQAALAQIDSIFVTVEKSNSPKSEPKGQKLMYAYLRDHPNHP